MSFPPEFLDELRRSVSLADVVGRRVSFDRRKSDPRRRDFWACCPFHGEKTPSFHVNDAEGYFYCFGCQARGDAISFLEQAENLSFREAVERLAAEASLVVPAQDPKARERQERRRTLGDVLEAAQRLYVKALGGREGEGARRYLTERGCNTDLWLTFGLGYATGRQLQDRLMAEGFASGLIEEAGLLGQDPERGPYERFRDRIMFPIRDGQDRLVGFGGRILRSDDKAPKYLNSPETPLFDKGRLLFNYAAARRSLRETGTLIVVEGYMDVIALHGAGFANAVAPLGTALTADQLGLLWKATGEPILCFDGDGAGIRAASRAIDLALPLVSPMRTLRIAYLPNGQDPDDLLKRQGPGAMQDILDRSLPLSEALFRKERGGGPLDTPERQSELKHRLGAAVSKITHQDLRKSYERAINDKWWALIRTPLPKTKSERGTSSTRNTPLTESLRRSLMMHESRREQAKPKPRLTAAAGASNFPEHQEVSHYLAEIDAALIGLILDHPELLPHVAEDFGHLEPAHGQERGKLDKIFSELIHLASAGERLDGDDLKDHLKRCGVGDAVEEVCARDIVRRMRIRWVGRSLGEAEHAWRMLAERHVKVQSLRADIEEAEAAALGDGPSADVHLQRLKALMAERQILERGSFWPEESGSGSSATDRSG